MRYGDFSNIEMIWGREGENSGLRPRRQRCVRFWICSH